MSYYSRERKDLKPCPFCGGEALIKYDKRMSNGCKVDMAMIFCNSCGCRTPEFAHSIDDFDKEKFEDTLVSHWNQRK